MSYLDLGNRSIFLTLAPIAEADRRPEGELWREFEGARPTKEQSEESSRSGLLEQAQGSGARPEHAKTAHEGGPSAANFAIRLQIRGGSLEPRRSDGGRVAYFAGVVAG